MSDKPKFVEWYATQLEGYLATKGHNPEEVLKYILNKLECTAQPRSGEHCYSPANQKDT